MTKRIGDYFDIVPSDVTLLKNVDYIVIGGAGNLCLKGRNGGTPCTPFPVVAGQCLPFGDGFVMSTGTTATAIVGFGGAG